MVPDDYHLLFHPIEPELPLLHVTNTELMRAIYRDNNGSWVKFATVPDPVTRLVSAYLDFVYALDPSLHSSKYHDWQQREGGDLDYINWFNSMYSGKRAQGSQTAGAIIPTFTDFIDALEKNMSSAPSAFRSVASLCGIQHSTFETVIPFETVKVKYLV